MTGQQEVIRLCQQIEEESRRARQALGVYATLSWHQALHLKLERIRPSVTTLLELVGQEHALGLLTDAFERSWERVEEPERSHL